MKKSRIAKLALLGASTAALAATLTTSTYAWYVSNKQANVTAVTGSTATAAADGSILLSINGDYGTFNKTITLGNFVPGNQGYGLNPIKSTAATSGFQFLDGTSASVGSVGGAQGTSNWTDAADVYHYTFYIVSPFADVTTVTPAITITNTTTNVPYQVNMSNDSTWNNAHVAQNAHFTSNALNALTILGTRTPHGAAYKYGEAGYNGTAEEAGFTAGTTTSVYGQALSTDGETTANTVGTYFKTVNNTDWTAISGNTYLTSGAHDYYNLFADTALTSAETTQATLTAFTTFSLTAGVPVRLDYYLYLDGADEACFNSCAGQGISVAFEFKAS
jgi:hypothetical protein